MPPTIGELEDRIEEAVTIARASETAVMSVGAAALEAANQAHRAAAIAERASAVALDAQKIASRAREAELEDKVLRGFSERADRVVARLRALERRSRRGAPSNAAAGRRRHGG